MVKSVTIIEPGPKFEFQLCHLIYLIYALIELIFKNRDDESTYFRVVKKLNEYI